MASLALVRAAAAPGIFARFPGPFVIIRGSYPMTLESGRPCRPTNVATRRRSVADAAAAARLLRTSAMAFSRSAECGTSPSASATMTANLETSSTVFSVRTRAMSLHRSASFCTTEAALPACMMSILFALSCPAIFWAVAFGKSGPPGFSRRR